MTSDKIIGDEEINKNDGEKIKINHAVNLV